ncbi:hypothetical protein SAMN05216251_12869 [Actinacidiphila alni]|uniref:Uncharacterized protein n=1 Tax=Actinacidiphila alni TaxID=380248 RepID=A0A1I2LEP1_9ACTN|nr:hypothetical protein [Actinacidiphila alni]SFF77745.1 hypothetical protein SAMN05216251_12869 [Actinacidiphila alni]
MDADSTTSIYDQLIAERGDVPAAVRKAAETIQRELDRDLEAFSRTAPADGWFR